MPNTFYTTPDGTTISAELLRMTLEELRLTRAVKACQALRVTLPAGPICKP